MDKSLPRILRFPTAWLIVMIAVNLGFFSQITSNIDLVLFFMGHLTWLGIYLTFNRLLKGSLKDNGQDCATPSAPPPPLNWGIVSVLYLLYSVCFWFHLTIIADSILEKLSFLSPGLVKSLFQYSSQLNSTFLMLVANVIACLIFLVLLLYGLRIIQQLLKDETSHRSHFAFLSGLLLILGLFAYYTFLALLRHDSFHSKAWDLAIFAQLIDNFTHGIFFEANVRGVKNIFSDHFSPIIYIFSPILFIWNDPSRLLLVVQTVFIFLGAIPVYLLTLKKTNSELSGIYIALVYLLLPALQFMNIFDFHPIALSIPLMLSAWYAWEIRRFGWMFAFLALCMLCQEEMWIVVGAFGLYLALFERERGKGILLTLIGWAGFVFLVTMFFPMFRNGEEYFYIHRYGYLGSTLGEIFRNFIFNPLLWLPRLISPRAIMFVLLMLLPVGFLPLFRPKILFILIPTYIYSALSIEPLQVSIFAQYSAPYIPFLMISTVYGLEAVQKILSLQNEFKQNSPLAICFILLCFVVIQNVYFSPYVHSKAYQSPQFEKPFFNRRQIESSSTTFNPQNSYSAGSKFAPHFINEPLHLFPNDLNTRVSIFDLEDYDSPDTIMEIDSLLHKRNLQVNSDAYPVLKVYSKDDSQVDFSEPLKKVQNLLQGPGRKYCFTSKQIFTHSGKSSPFDVVQVIAFSYRPYTGEPDYVEKDHNILVTNINKTAQPDKQYFGVLLFPREVPFLPFYGKKPEFRIIRLYSGMENLNLSPQSHMALVSWPIKKRDFESFDTSSDKPLFLFMTYPENNSNTLEEYFTEFFITNQLEDRIHWGNFSLSDCYIFRLEPSYDFLLAEKPLT